MVETDHAIALELGEPVASKVDAGVPLTLVAVAVCEQDCDLHDHAVRLTDAAGLVLADGVLAAQDDGLHQAELRFTTPSETGAQEWTLIYAGHEDSGHAPASLAIKTQIKPHDTSLAVWDVPSPLTVDGGFAVTVGATCSAGCVLAGKAIEILDASGAVVAAATLGDAVWPQTKALYYAQASLTAPPQTGRADWSVRFAPAELKLPHGAAGYHFGAEIVAPPEHTVTVKVVEKDSGAPLAGVQVRLGVYFAHSDQDGLARVETPKGTFELDVLKTGYDGEPLTVEVAQDRDLQVEMRLVPKTNPDAYWYHTPEKT